MQREGGRKYRIQDAIRWFPARLLEARGQEMTSTTLASTHGGEKGRHRWACGPILCGISPPRTMLPLIDFTTRKQGCRRRCCRPPARVLLPHPFLRLESPHLSSSARASNAHPKALRRPMDQAQHRGNLGWPRLQLRTCRRSFAALGVSPLLLKTYPKHSYSGGKLGVRRGPGCRNRGSDGIRASHPSV